MNQIYKKYLIIKEQTFNIFEIYHHQALVEIFKHDVTAKDLSLIMAINGTKNANPTLILNKIDISVTNLSNRLNYLEKKGFIKRSQNKDDLRKYDLYLTDLSIKIIDSYNEYVTNFITYVRKNLSISEKLSFSNFLNKWNSNKTNHNESNNKKEAKITGTVFEEIQNFFITNETSFIESLTIDLNYQDLFFLNELYTNQLFNNLTLPKLADYLFIPYQTVISKINKFISMKLISKENNVLTFSDELTRIIDHFISLRIIGYYEAMYGASIKEHKVVLKAFSLLKKYALNYINKD